MKAITMITLIGCLFSGVAMAQNDEVKRAATEMLENFKKSITEDNVKMMNFSSMDEVRSLHIGDEVKLFYIRLDDLKQYKSDQPTSSLIKATTGKMFVLEGANGDALGYVELATKDQKWQLRSINKSPLIKDLRTKGRDGNQSEWSMIRVLALGRDLAARQASDGWRVILLGQDPLGEIRAGQEFKFEDILPSLQQEANRYNGLPW